MTPPPKATTATCWGSGMEQWGEVAEHAEGLDRGEIAAHLPGPVDPEGPVAARAFVNGHGAGGAFAVVEEPPFRLQAGEKTHEQVAGDGRVEGGYCGPCEDERPQPSCRARLRSQGDQERFPRRCCTRPGPPPSPGCRARGRGGTRRRERRRSHRRYWRRTGRRRSGRRGRGGGQLRRPAIGKAAPIRQVGTIVTTRAARNSWASGEMPRRLPRVSKYAGTPPSSAVESSPKRPISSSAAPRARTASRRRADSRAPAAPPAAIPSRKAIRITDRLCAVVVRLRMLRSLVQTTSYPKCGETGHCRWRRGPRARPSPGAALVLGGPAFRRLRGCRGCRLCPPGCRSYPALA